VELLRDRGEREDDEEEVERVERPAEEGSQDRGPVPAGGAAGSAIAGTLQRRLILSKATEVPGEASSAKSAPQRSRAGIPRSAPPPLPSSVAAPRAGVATPSWKMQ